MSERIFEISSVSAVDQILLYSSYVYFVFPTITFSLHFLPIVL